MNKRTRFFTRIEALEARIAPATLNYAGDGAVTYTSGGGVFNFLILSLVGVNYRFSDSENITVTGPGASAATGSGTSIVDVFFGGVASLTFHLGDQDDTLLIRNLEHPLTVNDGAGDDTVRFELNTIMTLDGNISVASERVNINSNMTLVGSGLATISADNLAMNALLTTQGQTTIQPLSAGAGHQSRHGERWATQPHSLRAGSLFYA